MKMQSTDSKQCAAALLGSLVLLVCSVSRGVHAAPSLNRQRYIEVIRPAMPLDTGPMDVQQQQQQNIIASPRKRAAIALDKLMYALKKALDSSSGGSEQQRPMSSALRSSPSNRNFVTSGVDRRGQPDGRLYWRCYFNAVSCF